MANPVDPRYVQSPPQPPEERFYSVMGVCQQCSTTLGGTERLLMRPGASGMIDMVMFKPCKEHKLGSIILQVQLVEIKKDGVVVWQPTPKAQTKKKK